jgi:hypothetical protein
VRQILMKGRGYRSFMLIKGTLLKRLLLSVLIIFILSPAVFISAGCKGKEEKQPVAGPEQLSEQQAREGAPGTQGPPLSEESASSQSEGAANTPPRITSFDISPKNPVSGDEIKATVMVNDREGDSVNITYQWSKNDLTLPGTSDRLTVSSDFKRGDKISLEVVPDDGKTRGTALTMHLYVANSSPVIASSEETFRFDGNMYSYQIKASDPDGDPLSYSLKTAPSGMTIDPSTGLIKWNVPPSFAGKTAITTSVTDGQGGETLQSFNLEIKPDLSK